MSTSGETYSEQVENFQRQRDRGRAFVEFALSLIHRRKNPEIALVVDDMAVFDHPAFGENDDFAAAKDLGGEKRKQARKICRHRADVPQELGKGVASFEQFGRRDATAETARRLVNDVLGNDRFEAGEVIEQENLPVIELAVGAMDLDVDPKTIMQE